jgi:peptidoglycan/LPS O-acetylase OafA/YrhL
MQLNERLYNNYDFLRLFAAVSITYAHSFNHTPGYIEPLASLVNNKINVADIGLAIFFSISGYLIAKSALSSISLKNYFWKRLLRIQPLLIMVCFVSVIFIGPFFTTLSFKEYIFNSYTWTYFRNIFPATGIQFNLPGVFSTYTSENGVNGSLWTLIVEERLYLLLGAILFLPKYNKTILYFIAAVLNCCYLINVIFHQNFIPFINTSAGFYAILFLNGGVVFLLNINFGKQPVKYMLAGFLFFLLSIVFPLLLFLQLYALPVLILSAARVRCFTNKTGKYGDFTYGIYLFSFPVQQMLNSVESIRGNPYKIFFTTMLFVVPFSVISWHLVEKKMLQLKYMYK